MNEFLTFVNPAISFLMRGEHTYKLYPISEVQNIPDLVALSSPVSFMLDFLRIEALEQIYVSIQ